MVFAFCCSNICLEKKKFLLSKKKSPWLVLAEENSNQRAANDGQQRNIE